MLSKNCHVEMIEHSFQPGKRWTTTLTLSPAALTFYWVAATAGFSEAGTTTRAVY